MFISTTCFELEACHQMVLMDIYIFVVIEFCLKVGNCVQYMAPHHQYLHLNLGCSLYA
jgi:hypothetical protein